MGQRLMGIEPFMILCQVIVITKNVHFLELQHQAKWVLTIICKFVVDFQKRRTSFGCTNKLWAILARVVQGEQKLQLETIVTNWHAWTIQFQILWLITLKLHLEKSITSNIKSIWSLNSSLFNLISNLLKELLLGFWASFHDSSKDFKLPFGHEA